MSLSGDPSSETPFDDELPSRLADALAGLYPAPPVPGSVDERILNSARAHLARSAHWRRRRMALRWGGSLAAAAASAAAIFLFLHHPEQKPALAGDVNGDGRVDILDAYLVAHTLANAKAGQTLPATWDVNHDGVVDEKDVQWIANAAVHVNAAQARGHTPAGQLALHADVEARVIR